MSSESSKKSDVDKDKAIMDIEDRASSSSHEKKDVMNFRIFDVSEDPSKEDMQKQLGELDLNRYELSMPKKKGRGKFSFIIGE